MFLVGLTGGIATGKSTVTKLIQKYGIVVLDGDKMAREVVEPGTKAWNQIKLHFGNDIILENGHIDRVRLGEIIFSDAAQRKKLNSITHPEIYKKMFMKCLIHFMKGYQFIVLDLPLLYENGKMIPYIHKSIVVYCEPEQQLNRLMHRNGLTLREAKLRIKSQMSLEEKRDRADYVVDNKKEIDQLDNQIENIIAEIKKSKKHWKIRAVFWVSMISVSTALSWFTMQLM